MDSLTLKEKIGQLVQLDGRFFGAEEVPTGPCAELGIETLGGGKRRFCSECSGC